MHSCSKRGAISFASAASIMGDCPASTMRAIASDMPWNAQHRRARVDDELGQPPVAVLGRAEQAEDVSGGIGGGGPDLAAVDQPAALGWDRLGADRRESGTVVRFAPSNSET